MRYLKYRSKAAARTRSQEIWEAHLGRPVEPNATTRHFYDYVESMTSFGGSYLFVLDEGTHLTEAEKTNLEEEEWSHSDFQAWMEKYIPINP